MDENSGAKTNGLKMTCELDMVDSDKCAIIVVKDALTFSGALSQRVDGRTKDLHIFPDSKGRP